jgi:hypothetical protein
MMVTIGFPISFNGNSGPARVTGQKNRLIRYIARLLSGFLFLAMLSGSASPKWPMATDPIFGLVYSPDAIRFEAAPAALARTCAELTTERWNRQTWIFARTAAADGDYLVLGGFFLPKASRQPPMVDKKGVLLRLKGADCHLIGPVREVFDYKPEEIGTTTLQALAQDAVCRYARAYGGKEKFLDALRRQHRDLADPKSSILKDAVSGPSKPCTEITGH